MDTTIGDGERTAGLKLKIKFSKEEPDPKGLSRWDVFQRRYLIVEVLIGHVLAGSRDDALSKARALWPDLKRITVAPSEQM